jgi:hypothetical protein
VRVHVPSIGCRFLLNASGLAEEKFSTLDGFGGHHERAEASTVALAVSIRVVLGIVELLSISADRYKFENRSK